MAFAASSNLANIEAACRSLSTRRPSAVASRRMAGSSAVARRERSPRAVSQSSATIACLAAARIVAGVSGGGGAAGTAGGGATAATGGGAATAGADAAGGASATGDSPALDR